jgi:hypothetical protein
VDPLVDFAKQLLVSFSSSCRHQITLPIRRS